LYLNGLLVKNLIKIFFSLFLLLTFAACSDKATVDPFDAEEQAASDDALIREFMAKDTTIHDFTKTASGLYYIKRRTGSGAQVQSGNIARVHYIGRFLNGTKFDSSYDRNAPFPVTVDKTAVIQGWTEGLKLMKAGEKATLYIPSALGYGRSGTTNIPANTVLVFDIDVLSVTQ
jgi:FKBP-type peptidyl-prolyl cis-trans isomerase